jgi:hypothetical protein
MGVFQQPARTILACLSFLLPLGLGSQELSTFMSALPPPGAWARYRVETKKAGILKKEPFDLAVTQAETVGGKSYVWLEAGPTNFAGYRDGYMRLLVKAEPTPQEALNPFLSAVSLAYQEPGGDPFRLSDGAIDFMHSQAQDMKVRQEATELPPEKAVTIKGVELECTRRRITTTTETSFFTKKYKYVETGTYWFSLQTPFRIVKAEIERVEYEGGKEERRKEITVTLKEASLEGAETHFTKPAKKTKGLLGLLFH